MKSKYILLVTMISGLFFVNSFLADRKPSIAADSGTAKPSKPSKRTDGLVPLNKQETVLLDLEGKRVLLKSTVVLREGLLEMFACLKQTKEHESILSVDAKAYVVHAGLLAVGAKPGRPVQFVKPDPDDPDKFVEAFHPPAGQKIDVFVRWKDEKGKLHRVSAKQWVRNAIHRFYVEKLERKPADLTIPEKGDLRMLRYDERNRELSWYGPMSDKQRDAMLALSEDREYRKIIKSFYDQSRPREMEADWVFAGSRMFKDVQTKVEHYAAEEGTLICVANFPSAMIDVSIQSSDKEAEGILFEPFTQRIPPLETEVTIELIPVAEKKKPEPEAK